MRKLYSTDKTVAYRDLGGVKIVYLFTITSEFALPEAVTQMRDDFLDQVVFLTVNHRGPLPLRELHSTDET